MELLRNAEKKNGRGRFTEHTLTAAAADINQLQADMAQS